MVILDEELKTRLERICGPIGSPYWSQLEELQIVEQFHADAAAHGEKEAWKEFRESAVDHLRRLRKFRHDIAMEESGVVEEGSELRPGIALPLEVITDDSVFDPSEIAQAQAISEYMAGDADQHPAVMEFRNRVLGGNSVSAEEARRIIETPGQVSTDLHGLGSHLASTYPGWEAVAAMRFVLTGRTPELSLVKVRHTFTPPRAVTLTITPWVSAQSVERAYRMAQSVYPVPGTRKKKPRTFEAARFYWAQYRLEGKRLPWPVLFERWQRQHPAEEGFTTWRSFRQVTQRGISTALSTLRRTL